MLEVNFWQDKAKSQIVIKEKKLYENLLDSLNESIKKLKDFDDLNQLALDEKNIISELEQEKIFAPEKSEMNLSKLIPPSISYSVFTLIFSIKNLSIPLNIR